MLKNLIKNLSVQIEVIFQKIERIIKFFHFKINNFFSKIFCICQVETLSNSFDFLLQKIEEKSKIEEIFQHWKKNFYKYYSKFNSINIYYFFIYLLSKIAISKNFQKLIISI